MFNFGRAQEERLAAAAAALAPFGFVFRPDEAARVRRYLPLREASAPEHLVTACFGRIEDATVEAFEYESSSTDSDGNTSWSTSTLVAVHHPAIPGGASIHPDWPQWSTAAAVIDAVFWIPPFTILKLFQLAFAARNPDRIVGDADFDRLYVVHAGSDAEARAALTPALREALLRLRFRGTLELRPGALLYSPHDYRFDAETAVSAIGVATVLLGALR